jgi:hypothetical protein
VHVKCIDHNYRQFDMQGKYFGRLKIKTQKNTFLNTKIHYFFSVIRRLVLKILVRSDHSPISRISANNKLLTTNIHGLVHKLSLKFAHHWLKFKCSKLSALVVRLSSTISTSKTGLQINRAGGTS